jgi:hypothetical protein
MEKETCSICFDDITVDTGKVLTSCNHIFHFNCLAAWCYKEDDMRTDDREEEKPSSCPCCRKKFNKLEDLPTNGDLGLESEDEDEEDLEMESIYSQSQSYVSEEGEEEMYIHLSRFRYVNLSRVRLGVEVTETTREITLDPSNDPDALATKIKAIWKGYVQRIKYSDMIVARVLIQMRNG